MENASQPELLAVLAQEFELKELGQSIAANGYFSEEPLVTIKDEKKGKWIVVEGNRRLAALMLLNDPDSAPKDYRAQWKEISEQRQREVIKVPILEYEHRDQITPYLGYRHITGVLEWKPLQKGRYIAQLVESSKLTFAQIARLVGSKQPTVREHYTAYTLLRQARDAFAIDTQYAERTFGVLRRALSDPNIRNFIGLELDKSQAELRRPLPKAKAEEAKELLTWMFGDGKTAAALKDSRQLRQLGVVLGEKRAIAALRTSNSVEYAYEYAGGEERRLVEVLNSAGFHLDQALPMALRHHGKKDVIAAMHRCYETFTELLRHFPSIAKKPE